MNFDWRTSTAPFENDKEKEKQTRFKGSGGYREIWRELLKIFITSSNAELRKYSTKIAELNK